ncbi:MAG: rod shape-determining protein RodA [Candidatus Eisenbacteria bacterium]|nr:rod shape-determining protein RodA [Candidatus Eisenbacteria bacterium]
MLFRREYIRHIDWVLLVTVFLLLGVGLLLVFSATQPIGKSDRHDLFPRQLLWVATGLIVMCFVAVIPQRVFDGLAPYFYSVAVLLLTLVLFAGTEAFGARRWLAFGSLRFQPSEFSKFALIILLARFYSKPRTNMKYSRNFIIPLLLSVLPVLLILKEPDLGSAISILFIFLAMAYWAGTPKLYLILMLSPVLSTCFGFITPLFVAFVFCLGFFLYYARIPLSISLPSFFVNIALGAGSPLVWRSLEQYQRDRILTFIDPGKDPLGAGYQIIQSKIAIGSGGVFGKGFLEGTQKALSFLPAQHTDFIFSVLGEEFGLLGSLFVILLFFVLFLRCISISVKSPSKLGSLLVVGASASIFYNAVVNTWMAVGLAPVTGIPLPFVSYGGSSLLTTLSLAGLVFNVHLRRHEF